jgi:hypothetical protein
MVRRSVHREIELRLKKIEALADLARSRLGKSEREPVVGALEAAAAEARRALERPPVVSEDVIRNAEEKAAQAEADRAEKRRPYEADPLFMYLWRRRFGTRDYDATNFVRYFDRKVAHLIGYEAARVNYAMLMELPERLREHAARLKQESGRQSGEDPRLLEDLSAVEDQPEVAALLRDATANPGPDGAILDRIADVDRALHDIASSLQRRKVGS